MHRTCNILKLTDRGWTLSEVDARWVNRDDTTATDERSGAWGDGGPAVTPELLDALNAHPSPGDLIATIPSLWCLTATVSTEALPRKQRREAVLYRMEDKFPVEVEQLTIDFVEHHRIALGVGIEHSRAGAVCAACEQAGFRLTAIVPEAWLHLAMLGNLEAGQYLVAGDDKAFDLVQIQNQRPFAWHQAHGAVDVLRQLRRLTIEQVPPIHVYTLGLTDELTDQISRTPDVELHRLSPPASVEQATQLVSGQRDPWINLRRDALAPADRHARYRQSAWTTAAAVVVFAATLSAAFLWRSHQYNGFINDLHAQQQDLFRSAMPDQAIPTSIQSRLASEARRLQGTSGASGQVPIQASALRVLHQTLQRLPSKLRYRILVWNIDGNSISLEGEARSHGDADTIASALRQQPGYQVTSPQTETIPEGGVTFTIQSKAAPPPDAQSQKS